MAITNVKIYLTHDQMSLETNQYRIEFDIPTEGIVVVEIHHGTLTITVVPPETPNDSPYEPEDSDNGNNGDNNGEDNGGNNGGPENASQN